MILKNGGASSGGVHGQRGLVDGDHADAGQGSGGLQDDQAAGADPEDHLRTRFGQDSLKVFHLGAHAVVGQVRAGQAAPAPVGQVDGEVAGQGLGEQRVAAGRLHAAVHDHDGRTAAGLQVADRGAVTGGDAAAGHRRAGVNHVNPRICGGCLDLVAARLAGSARLIRPPIVT
jgi:hypothetical protein